MWCVCVCVGGGVGEGGHALSVLFILSKVLLKQTVHKIKHLSSVCHIDYSALSLTYLPKLSNLVLILASMDFVFIEKVTRTSAKAVDSQRMYVDSELGSGNVKQPCFS